MWQLLCQDKGAAFLPSVSESGNPKQEYIKQQEFEFTFDKKATKQ